MGLKLIKDNGKVRRTWYGQYRENGVWKVTKLTTPMRGQRIPSRLSDKGDDAFERSRVLAQAEFDRFQADREVKGSTEHLTRVLIESKTGKKVEDVRLDELAARWKTMPRSYTPTEKCTQNAELYFTRFAQHANVTYLYEVTQEMVTTFFDKTRKEYSWSTTKSIMSILKSAFARFLPSGAINPFAAIIKRNRELNASRVNRRPLSDNELAALIELSRADPMVHELAVTTACTGMRIGDVCNLKWESVDLRSGFVNVVTAKAGKSVTIPIFDPLRKILEGALVMREDDEPFVFPSAAQMYKYNPDGIYHRGKVLFARALFTEEAEKEANTTEVEQMEKTPTAVVDMIRSAGFSAQKTERCVNVYTMYRNGMTYRQIERETMLSRGQISEYLHGIEALTGNTIVKWARVCATSNSTLLRKTRQERKVGKRAASLFGWHSLRASFVVTALNAGVPIEMVRRIVGHSTTRMTEEYFNPTKSIIAETMKRKMVGSVIAGRTRKPIVAIESGSLAMPRPQLGSPSNLDFENILAIVSRMTAKERTQLKKLLANNNRLAG